MTTKPVPSPEKSLDYAKAKKVDSTSIPVIDVSGRHDALSRPQLIQKLLTTAEDTGFFYVSNHGIPRDICDQAFDASRRFFALPVASKEKITVDQYQRGWMQKGLTSLEGSATHDSKEVFFWGYDIAEDDPDLLAGQAMVAVNQWPDDDAPFLKDNVMPYYDAVLDLGRDLMALLAEGLGQDREFFSESYEKPLGRGQLVYYPPMDISDHKAQRFGAAAHTDFGVLTILMQDDLGGLQIRAKDGDWIEAPPVPDTFVCNIGDLLQMWTNGRLTSTLHRVINRREKARFSIPIFFDPASTTVINPQEFDDTASSDAMTTAGEYIQAKNKRNFSHYTK